LLDFSAIFGLTARILVQKAEISIPGNEEPEFFTCKARSSDELKYVIAQLGGG